jgi:hypothetical protein
MKTTIDLPEAHMAEAMRHTHATTKTVSQPVADSNRRLRMAALTKHLGTFRDFMTQDDLRKMREDSSR